MGIWVGRLERAQLLLWPVAVGIVGILQSGLPSGGGTLTPLDVSAALIAVIAPAGAGVILALLTRDADFVLLSLAAMLTSISVVLLYTSGREVSTTTGFFENLALRQALFVCAGYVALVVGVFVAHRIDTIGNYPYTMAIGALLLTTTTAMFGTSVNGARLWLNLGVIQFQPGEVTRLFLTTFIAIYLHSKRHQLAGTWRVSGIAMPAAPHLVPLAIGVSSAIAVLAWQNDLGMAAAIGLVAACFAAGATWSLTGTVMAIAIVVFAASLASMIVPRIGTRVQLWLDPWSAPMSSGYQFVQGDYSLATGGLSGTPTMATVARVPEFQTDFVVVAIASRFGVVVAIATLCLIALLVLRCIVVALHTHDELAKFIGVGISLMLGVQSVLIIGGALRLLPLTGLTVPLVSYGGTSLLVTLFAVGVMVGLNAQPRWRRRPTDVIRRKLRCLT